VKTILVIGASSDIGMAYIHNLEASQKENDVRVIAIYRTMSAKFMELVSSLKNILIETIQADLSMPHDVANMIDMIKQKKLHPTHILHLAAGKFQHMRIRDFDYNRTRLEMDIQVFSLAEIFKAFLPTMSKNQFGRVVVMLTAYTIGIPPKFLTDYIVCKYALLGLMKAAAAEYSHKGVCINGVSPSMVETKFLDDLDSRVVEMTANDSPLKRNINVDEVVTAIEFLMSADNSYMSGTNINLSGGGR